MRIAQVAPLFEPVPPRGYGGTERVVSWLTEELVRRGHDVTLFASGNSLTRANLVAACPEALRTNPTCQDALPHHVLMLEKLREQSNEFDIIHFHLDYLHLPFCRQANLRHITTQHGRLDIPDLIPLFREFDDAPMVSISHRQRAPLSFAHWTGNVYHGMPKDALRFYDGPGKYLAFLGRISPEKRPDRAIEIAVRTGLPLKIAAKVDPSDKNYFESVVRPLLSQPGVEFIGEIGDSEKGDFLGNAIASLAPIDWPEPFGLNLIEAMACGTPTIGFNRGSVPEIIDDGISGIIVESADEAVKAVGQVVVMSRRACRQAFEKRFTADRMAEEYLEIYRQILSADSTYVGSAVSEDVLSQDVV
jgi:glycosyltransferase involved in cell wall biosynthesis